jgi:hypothetical protein
VPAVGQRPRRADPTPQHHYWRHVDTELHAAANTTPLVFTVVDQGLAIVASTGPTATGEVWSVDQVQVNLNLYSPAPPLVIQQIGAQTTGGLTPQPPPVVAQVWLSVGGTPIHLLAQSSQGVYDNIGLGGQQIRAGEQVSVYWWLTSPFGAIVLTHGWAVLRGTRRTLSPT